MEKEIVLNFDSTLMNLEVSLEYAKLMINDLSENYFVWDPEEKAHFILYDHESAGTRCHIAQDYLHRMGKAAEELRKLVNSMPMKPENNETEVENHA